MFRINAVATSIPVSGAAGEASPARSIGGASTAAYQEIPGLEGLAPRGQTGIGAPSAVRSGARDLLINSIQEAIGKLREPQAEAAEAARPSPRMAAAVPTPSELTQIQKEILRLSTDVQVSRRALVAQTRGVEALESQIRSIETALQKIESAPPSLPATVPERAPVDLSALRRRRGELEKDIRDCKAQARAIGERLPKAREDAAIRAEYRGSRKEAVAQSWLLAGVPRASSGRRGGATDREALARMKRFFAHARDTGSASQALAGARRNETGGTGRGDFERLMEALSGDVQARDAVAFGAARWLTMKTDAARGSSFWSVRAQSSAWRIVQGAVLVSAGGQTGSAFAALLIIPENRLVVDRALEHKAQEFLQLLKPPAESPEDLAELQAAWETRARSQRQSLDAINAQLRQGASVPAVDPGSRVEDRRALLLAERERVVTSMAGQADSYARALSEHAARAELLEQARARLEQARADMAGDRGAHQRWSAGNAEARLLAARAQKGRQDEVWKDVLPALGQAFSPEALKRTLERHLELSDEALQGRLDPQRTRATTYASRLDLLVAVADVLRSEPGEGDRPVDAERIVAHGRQVGHGLRLMHSGPPLAAVSHATSFRLDEDGRIAHMFPWISPSQRRS